MELGRQQLHVVRAWKHSSGTYDSNRLANLSIGYVAVDSGFGYTYFNPGTGHEFSAVAGLTYSGTNSALQYQNGIDFHVDWAMSKFIGKSVHVGIAGYVYQQVTGDSGAGAKLGDFKGHATGIGPQLGFSSRPAKATPAT